MAKCNVQVILTAKVKGVVFCPDCQGRKGEIFKGESMGDCQRCKGTGLVYRALGHAIHKSIGEGVNHG